MKKILILMLVSVHSLAYSYEINYTRTYNKIVAEHNELSLQLKNDGTMSLTAPTFNASPPVPFTVVQTEKVAQLNEFVESLLLKKTNSLDRKLKLIKNQQKDRRFYSSEVDHFKLQISEDGKLLKNIEFSNFQELKYYYDQLGEWQPLVDLVVNMENQIVEIKVLKKSGGDK